MIINPSTGGSGLNLTGTTDQVVGFDANGKPAAVSKEEMRGPAGADGVSPTVSVAEISGGHSVSINDANGTTSFDVMNGEKGETGPAGADGKDGAQGPAGPGVPSGGSAGQVLAKKSAADHDTTWTDPPAGGVSSFNKRAGAVMPAAGDYSVEQITGAAPKESPVFTGSLSLVRASGSTVGKNSVAVGYNPTASGTYSCAEGYYTTASGSQSHAECAHTTASGAYSHAEGFITTANGDASHAEGQGSEANGKFSHAGGSGCMANGDTSFAMGANCSTKAANQTSIGKNNKTSDTESDTFIIGKGASVTARANCFRVTWTGTYAAGSYNATGADYAELFEWADGNPGGEDRAGRFVTLEGEKIRLAGPGEDYILGIVSGNPSVVGDVHDDQWAGMYLYDIFGRPLWEDVEVPDQTMDMPDPENPEKTVPVVVVPAHTEHRQKLNPDYDGSQPYLPRSQRPEWDAVGMLGKLVAVDDGSCEVNGWCTVGEGGAATASKARTRFRVMARLDESHVRVLVL